MGFIFISCYINAKVTFIKADNALINVGWLYKREGGIQVNMDVRTNVHTYARVP